VPTILQASSACRACGQRIAWVTTSHGNAMPVDPEPTPAGNVAVMRDGAGRVISRVATQTRPPEAFETVYMPHVATCSPLALFRAPPAGGSNVIPINRRRRRAGGR
jgi:hypothetical protein